MFACTVCGLHFDHNIQNFNSLACGRCNLNINLVISKLILVLYILSNSRSLPSGECHKTPLMSGQHYFKQWPGTIRQQAINGTKVDQVYDAIWCH